MRGPEDVDTVESGAYWGHQEKNLGHGPQIPVIAQAMAVQDLAAH